jgi:hypothetical protein
MTPKEILEFDLERNQPDYMDLKKVITFINYTIKNGGKLIREGNTLMLFRKLDDDSVEFHSFSADKPTVYLSNMAKFAAMLKKMGFEYAVTQFQNPKQAGMFKAAGFEAEINKTSEGYEAKVRL